jgi:hypothetical protein
MSNAKSNGAMYEPKNGGSDSNVEIRVKIAKARGEFEAAMSRGRKALAEADAALKIGSR